MEEQKETVVPAEGVEGSGRMAKCKERIRRCKEKMCQHKKPILIGVGVLVLIVALGVGGYFYNENREQKRADAVKSDTETFIKENLVAPGTEFQIEGFAEEEGLYKMTIAVGKQKVDAYVTKDGKKLFPQAFDMVKKEGEETEPKESTPAPLTEVTNKQDVPTVELFVMSYCPYGTQAEKGIVPAVKALGSKIKFDVKFVSYIMHGKKEFDENINQYCIQKLAPNQFLGYLDCFNKGGNSAKCMTSYKISTAKINACIKETDAQFKLTEAFDSAPKDGSFPPFNIQKDLNDQYGVQGSPTLVINGQVIDSARDSASFLKAICSGFTKEPAACSAKLSSTAPVAGFGDGTAPAAPAGSTAPAASCQ